MATPMVQQASQALVGGKDKKRQDDGKDGEGKRNRHTRNFPALEDEGRTCFALACEEPFPSSKTPRGSHCHPLRHDLDHLAEHLHCWAPAYDENGHITGVCPYARRGDRKDQMRTHLRTLTGHRTGHISEPQKESFVWVSVFVARQARRLLNRAVSNEPNRMPEDFVATTETRALLHWADTNFLGPCPPWVPGHPAPHAEFPTARLGVPWNPPPALGPFVWQPVQIAVMGPLQSALLPAASTSPQPAAEPFIGPRDLDPRQPVAPIAPMGDSTLAFPEHGVEEEIFQQQDPRREVPEPSMSVRDFLALYSATYGVPFPGGIYEADELLQRDSLPSSSNTGLVGSTSRASQHAQQHQQQYQLGLYFGDGDAHQNGIEVEGEQYEEHSADWLQHRHLYNPRRR